jgi:hypothetical protein
VPSVGGKFLLKGAFGDDARASIGEDDGDDYLAIGVVISHFYVSSVSFAVVLRMNKVEWHLMPPKSPASVGSPQRSKLVFLTTISRALLAVNYNRCD